MQQELNLNLPASKKYKYKMAQLTKREKEAILIAWAASQTSEDPYVKTGACAIRHDKSVAGVGYNGAPPNVEVDWSNRDERRKYMVHAEPNALAYTQPGECEILAVTLFPCMNCLNTMARYGVKTVIFADFYDVSSGYGEYKVIFDTAEKYGIELKQVVDFHQYLKKISK